MRRTLLVLGLGCAALAAATWAVAPPAAVSLALPADPLVVRGAFHVHTTLSDGAGTPDEVARAAAAAGLRFVILTDHGDATREPASPRYVAGVLLVDAVEISTAGGHYAALGLGRAPYRLAGEPRDVIADVARLGGFGVVTHPDSPKGELAWREWQAPFDGLEWLNADSAWRDESRGALARALSAYWLRGPEVIASLFDRPTTTLARWDAASRRRPVVAMAGHDAHARAGARGEWEPADGSFTVRIPSYETAFRAFSLGVTTGTALTGRDAEADAGVLLAALRAGRVVTVIDAIAGPAHLAFTARRPDGEPLDTHEIAPGNDVRLSAALTPPVPGAEVVVIRDGTVAARSRDASATLDHPRSAAAAAYRVEVLYPGAPGTPPVPWMVSNAIRIGFPPPRASLPILPAARWARPAPQAGWRIEQHAASRSRLEPTMLTPTSTAWTLTWQLGGGPPAGQYAAIAVPVPRGLLDGADRISCTVHSKFQMRVSVQLRSPEGAGRRWQRSVYVSPAPGAISVPVREMTPVDAAAGTTVDVAAADTLLLVIDTVNTAPGTAGELTVSELRVEGGD